MLLPAPVPIRLDRQGARAATLLARLQAAGYQAWFAGGCVRDLLIQRVPHDYDIATNASPAQLLALFPQARAVGQSFPVVRISDRGHVIDLASFRRDGRYIDGRHPEETSPGTISEDAQRRDFTVNALYLDPVASMLRDDVGGLSDIRARTLRFVGDAHARLQEDHLRLLRAIRFSTSLDMAMGEETIHAIARHAPLLARISMDRIRDELSRCFAEARHPAEALVLLTTTGLMPHTLPGRIFEPGEVSHLEAMLSCVDTPLPELMLAILLHTHLTPTESDPPRTILKRLRFSNEFSDTVCGSINLLTDFLAHPTTDHAAQRRLVTNPNFTLAAEINRITAKVRALPDHALKQLSRFQNSLTSPHSLPDPWITGDDLIVLGIAVGPDMARWKRLAHNEQMRGRYATKAHLLQWLTTEMKSPHA